MGEDATELVLPRIGQQIVDVAVEVGSRLVHDEKGGSAVLLRYRRAFERCLQHKRDDDAAEVRVRVFEKILSRIDKDYGAPVHLLEQVDFRARRREQPCKSWIFDDALQAVADLLLGLRKGLAHEVALEKIARDGRKALDGAAVRPRVFHQMDHVENGRVPAHRFGEGKHETCDVLEKHALLGGQVCAEKPGEQVVERLDDARGDLLLGRLVISAQARAVDVKHVKRGRIFDVAGRDVEEAVAVPPRVTIENGKVRQLPNEIALAVNDDQARRLAERQIVQDKVFEEGGLARVGATHDMHVAETLLVREFERHRLLKRSSKGVSDR